MQQCWSLFIGGHLIIVAVVVDNVLAVDIVEVVVNVEVSVVVVVVASQEKVTSRYLITPGHGSPKWSFEASISHDCFELHLKQYFSIPAFFNKPFSNKTEAVVTKARLPPFLTPINCIYHIDHFTSLAG